MPALTLAVPPGGVLFDSDGVLVDSDACVEQAWGAWAQQHGLDPALVLAEVHGHPARQTVAKLIAPQRRTEALALIDRLELEAAGSVRPLPGAAALLGSLPRDRFAVVTSGNGVLARARLQAADLPTPVHLVTADDVARGKPDADPYVAGARALGIPPACCIVFEDAPVGIRSARAAGAGAVVGVGRSTAGEDVDAFVPDLGAVTYDGTLRVPDLRGDRPG